MCQNSCIPGVPCCIFVFQAEDDFLNKKETFKPKVKQIIYNQKKPLMFTKQAIQYVIWSRQRDNGFPIASRSVPVNFSLGPRSSLVRLSLVIR